MRLRELKAKFIKRDDSRSFREVETKAEADGVMFLCPVCFKENNGPVGTHSIICWEPSVPQDTEPVPGRWTMQGNGIDDLTLVAASSSIFLQKAPCKAHFFVRNGEIA